MKKLLMIITMLGAGFLAGAQSSYEYTTAVYKKIMDMDAELRKSYGDSMQIRRIETGILTQTDNVLKGSITRTLFSGNRYIFFVFTDRRCTDLKMNVYSTNGDNWSHRQSMDKNEKKTLKADDLYGDYEILSVTPDTSQEYKIEIVAPVGNAAAARFGMMIWSRDVSSSSTTGRSGGGSGNNSGSGNSGSSGGSTSSGSGSTYYSMSSTKTCYWRPATKDYGDCKESDQSSLMVFNSNKTVFTHTTDNATSKYYVQSSKYNSEKELTQYEVVSDAGNKYTFMVPDDGKSVLVLNTSDDNTYYVKFFVKRKWSE